MIKFTKSLWIAAILILLNIKLLYARGDTFLYIYTDPQNVGEHNQLKGIARSLQQIVDNSLKEEEFTTQETQKLFKAIADNLNPGSGNRGIILAAEAHSISTLQQIVPQNNIIIALSAHQFNKDYEGLRDIVDIVALPQHTLTSANIATLSSAYTDIIQTIGVAHNLTAKDIKEAYTQNHAKIPKAEKYLGIILGGDAPTPKGDMLYYSAEEAQNLAKYVAAEISKDKDRAHLLILNGPRTGKHDHTSKELKVLETSHRKGVRDPVTRSFIDQLFTEGLTEGDDFTLFDFQYGQPSEYKTVLGALLNTNSPLLVAGESTSMVSETADCLPHGLVTAYIHGAMNQNHLKHCMSEKEGGRIKLLEDWQIIEASSSSKQEQKNLPASEMIAQAIYAKLKAKTAGVK